MSFSSNHDVEPSSSNPSQECREFTISETKRATHKFDESRLLGSGGFAKVYKGTISHGERILNVAIKRLVVKPRPGSTEEADKFWYEVAMISKQKHPHLVSQIGYCSDGQEFIFVYDYVSRGTLYHHLHKGGIPLSWVRRLKICLQTASGLKHLHTETDTKSMVLHLDVKSSNILLASNWVAKLSDYGLSKVRPTDSAYFTEHVRGTEGYVDPHFIQTGEATRKTDVFAFGVLMLEVLCQKTAYPSSIDGKRQYLRAWALDSIRKGRQKKIVDPNLEGRISSECLNKFAKLACKCLREHPDKRPTMTEVEKDLEYILTLQEKTDMTSNQENSVGGITLKSLDRYLFTVGGEDRIVLRFSFNIILQATNNFSEANKLLSSGYKFMYKGKLHNGRVITIAHYSDVNKDMYEECKNDASILVKLEHKNVIQLLGYCIDRTNVYLIFDFACNATLAGLLFDPMCDILNWNIRYNIILGVVKGLIYLHSSAPIQIIHFDLKPENILLDESFEPKLSGFGFATAVNETERVHFDQISGTMGHTAPELLWGCSLSTKADVFSFGVFILNIVTGRKAFDGTGVAQDMLIDYVRRNWLEGTLSNIVDPRIDVADSTLMTKFMEIGLLCVEERDAVRPTMEQVSAMLLGTLPLTLPISEMRARMINGEPLHQFTLSEIRRATQNFDKSLVIGQGLSTTVYRGSVTNGKRLFNVAIKRVLAISSQEAKLWDEVETLSKFKHPHLVSLIGYCGEKRQIILVYEYMPNGTLADRFQKARAPLTWVQRLKICLEAARCLDYLHSETNTKPSVIHRNVSSSTILLASNWAAKISGFGLSKLNLTNHLSDFGDTLLTYPFEYVDSYHIQKGRLTLMSDVYSFGVVMLEVLRGQKTVYTSIDGFDGERKRLRTWAQDFAKEERLEKIMDPNLVGRVSSDCLMKFARLAQRCLLKKPNERPTMVEVVKDLESILDSEEKSNRTSLQ